MSFSGKASLQHFPSHSFKGKATPPMHIQESWRMGKESPATDARKALEGILRFCQGRLPFSQAPREKERGKGSFLFEVLGVISTICL